VSERTVKRLGVPEVTAAVRATGVVAILRAPTAAHFPRVVDTLLTAGVRIVEVTLTTPGAVASIAGLTRSFGEQAIIGAGSVITADSAEACFEAGARFVVSPTAAPDVVAAARVAGIAAYAGAMTPTEALAVHMSGASVKLFPASAVEPGFITELHGPLPDIEVVPTGGITIESAGAWIRAGAAAVGLGGALLGTAGVDGDIAGLRDRARRVLAAVAEARGSDG
jgi:2-dehydro-3-deoxyphosphogluconate aldolase/(4S)-4-hydroxy-2-oxoglutarate aldolase